MPQFYIERNLGKKAADIFMRVGFAGDHSRTIAQVDTDKVRVIGKVLVIPIISGLYGLELMKPMAQVLAKKLRYTLAKNWR